MTRDWDEKHLTAERSEPLSLVMEMARRLPPGRALDLACGTGRHSIWLAQQGWDVTAVDYSPVAIGILRQDARGLSIRTVLADLEKNEFELEPSSWDLIVVSCYLQRDLFPKLGPALRPGGIAVVTVRLTGRFGMEPGELRACFAGWETLHDREDYLAEFAGRPPHSF